MTLIDHTQHDCGIVVDVAVVLTIEEESGLHAIGCQKIQELASVSGRAIIERDSYNTRCLLSRC